MARRPPAEHLDAGNTDVLQREKRPLMIRGVSQLLFNYLPERTVDWEDGLAVVKLGGVQLADAWPPERARILLEEIAQLLDRWRFLGGTVDPNFPDPRHSLGRFTVGIPTAIDAVVLQTAYLCQQCHALTFPKNAELAREDHGPLRCKACGAPALRQFGQVFVHGCGELVPVQAFIPGARKGADGIIEPIKRPLRCEQCGEDSVLEMTAHSERVSDMKIVCRRCHTVVLERMTARCPRCTRRLAHEQRAQGITESTSPVARIAMRLSRYSANDTYYPQTVTLLRLDRPSLITEQDPDQLELRSLLPLHVRPQGVQSKAEVITALSEQLRHAEEISDEAEKLRVLTRIAAVAMGADQEHQQESQDPPPEIAPDLAKGIQESLAFRTTVNSRSALVLARQSAVGQLRAERTAELQRELGLREIALVDDLPVITATFGYTRRSFDPTYEELGTQLPTEIRVFPSLDPFAANRLGRQDLVGTVPVLAREGEHQGLFLSLDPERVVKWLGRNGVDLPEGPPALTRILTTLEPIDRYYDQIWERRVRRLVFGLVHTLSHAVMRATSWFAGLERTSLSEYVFLPLLGTVVFDTSSAFQLGGIETLVRDHLTAFLEQLPIEALTCIYDTDCIDGRGACHGCVHAPEIACRFFNHGLSRAFLLGGHVPWLDVSDDQQLAGYWQEEDA